MMSLVSTWSTAGSTLRLVATELVRAELALCSEAESPDPVPPEDSDGTVLTYDTSTDTPFTSVDVTVAGVAAASAAADLLVSRLELFAASTVATTSNVAPASRR